MTSGKVGVHGIGKPYSAELRELGVDYVGICCGAGPHHVRAMAEAGPRGARQQVLPSVDLHSMFRAEVSARDAAFLQAWNA